MPSDIDDDNAPDSPLLAVPGETAIVQLGLSHINAHHYLNISDHLLFHMFFSLSSLFYLPEPPSSQ